MSLQSDAKFVFKMSDRVKLILKYLKELKNKSSYCAEKLQWFHTIGCLCSTYKTDNMSYCSIS